MVETQDASARFQVRDRDGDVDETNARVEFSLAWSPQSECAVIGRFLASMRASAADKGVDASAS